jgi:IS605 OrfB family transposase
MKSVITYNTRIFPKSKEEFQLLYDTMLEHQKVWNHMSYYTFKTKNINKKLIHDKNYHQCRKLFPECPSQIIIRAKDSVYSTYKTIKSNKQLSKMDKPAKQTNLSVRLDKRIYTFLENSQIKLTTTGKRIVCDLEPYEKFNHLFNTYAVCDPLIFFKDNQFWLAVSFEIPTPTHIDNSYLGVDLGERRLITTSEGLAIDDKQFLKDKRKLRYQKRMLNSKRKTNDSSSSKKKLKKLKRKERNKNKNLCHHLSNSILETNSNTIVLEDLSSLKKNKLGKKNYKSSKSSKNRLSQMPFYVLLEILSYKAPLKGKRVVTVNPRNTSQDDYRGFKRGERKGCRYYASDGKVLDADWNAAINIAKRYSQKKEAMSINHPVSFSEPIDGKLNLTGRLYQLANRVREKSQMQTPRSLV